MRFIYGKNGYKMIIIFTVGLVLLSLGIGIFLTARKKQTSYTAPVIQEETQTTEITEIIRNVYPAENTALNPYQELTITANAYQYSTLIAYINGTMIPMTKGVDGSDGYALFTCTYTMPENTKKTKSIGTVSVQGSYNGINQSLEGAEITLNADENAKSQANTKKESSTSGNNINQGTGATAIKITQTNQEVRELIGNEVYYNPFLPLQAENTVDYVIGEYSYYYDGETTEMYKLASGMVVRKDACVSVFNANSSVTLNRITAVSAKQENGLTLKLSNLWNVPYRLSYYKQGFSRGYEGLKYNVSSFTATAIDFIFHYSNFSAGEFSAFDDEIVSRAELITNKDNTVTLRLHLRNAGKFYGYTLKYDENNNMIIHIKKPHRSLQGLTVAIDAGHGGEPGAVDVYGKNTESTQVLEIAKYLATFLTNAGAKVYMTRTTDVSVPLEERRSLAERTNADLSLSIHLNGSVKKEKFGTSTFYYTPFSSPFASCINSRLVQAFQASCYKDNSERYNAVDCGKHYYPFYVARTNYCPSLLIEVGYITNELEGMVLCSSDFQQYFAQAIYLGIADFVAGE